MNSLSMLKNDEQQKNQNHQHEENKLVSDKKTQQQ